MSSTDSEFPVALTELQQVSATISQGANFFEAQINSGQPAASVTESTKAYAAEVLQAATQHLLNTADLVDGTIADQSAFVSTIDRGCNQVLQNTLATQAKTDMQHLATLQTSLSMHRHPKAYNPAGFQDLVSKSQA